MGRALAAQKLGQVDVALAAYEDVLSQDPSNVDALTNMLGMLKGQNTQLAVQKLSDLRETYPFNADITAQLGVAYAGTRDYENALKYLDMADALRPGSTLVTYNRAVVYDHLGRPDLAIPLYNKIVQQAADGTLDSPVPVESIQRRLSVLR
jgi:tetratricopeptide (TPR) repeat protein